mmetsp:Transcript_10208/g.21507  ORF Transcript_10208/g.21507 Transcript_10208/m.21507 type:complete len:226 (-) Transcript_10208:284-961(-)|eukprot:CAMPEP_0201187092 /NCGR_PEP_ID=MMETSP0851-20130426/132831_1 /ASSEMBLY_ACC=CAM_ASM_000631 /TAXON_ID=183588 /ORGANISM="Pseudo-nitzschia fraudulenta, Strain WWA7" /LENGTH=225 /DNA_ID=CAMNT_0047472521 /DNA_START=217 /DNA_END=894 /DNA_ORIENTATION=+
MQATTKLVGSSLPKRQFSPSFGWSKRCFSFSFAGPKKLHDILKKELVEDKSRTEISDLWYTYHESKDNVHGLVLGGKETKALIPRAAISPFYIQPIFRDDGHFMLVSQFFEPSHFIMAYLEDYKMDPTAAQPLLSFSIFDDYADDKDLTLVRADIMNNGIDEGEGLKVVKAMLDNYKNDDEYLNVRAFNTKPDSFDLDGFIAQQSEKWNTANDDKTANKTVDIES